MGKYGVLAGRDKKLLSFVSVVFFVFICLCSGSVFASHNSSAELQPEWSSSGQNTEYAVTVMNSLGSDPIDEVRIFRALNYTNFDCKNKTGWELLEDITWYDPDLGGFTKMCWYYTLNSSNNIPAGGDEVFEFSATVPLSGCNHKWKFETRDEESSGSGDWRMIFANTSVDDDAPNVTKTINGAQSGSCPPGSGEECWIRQDTEIQIDIMEAGLCGVSGLDFCEVTYTLDGSAPIPVVYVEFNETPLTTSWNYSMTFDNDSLHVLNVTCKDIAGNILEDIEKFRVDDTPPETTKTYGNPHFPYTINNTQYPHWITTHTPITLAANDPDPTGHGCNISNMTTYYRNVYEGPHGLPGFCENYNVCMTWQPSAWDACGWIEYTVPFFKNEESCHIIEYYSVDELGNREPVKHQCVFVEDTPPTADKIIGEPKIPCNANMENNHIVAAQAGVQGVSPVTLYVIADNSKQPNLLEAYNVEANGTLTYVSNYTLPTVGNGAVGTALDTVNDKLFVTFELFGGGTGYVYVFDANNFNPIGNISTAGSDLAGVFVDTNQGYLYVADRVGSNVYVYDTTTYAYITTYSTGLNIYGMALDHNNNKIYVTDGSTTVREYNTTMNLLNTYSLPNGNVGIAVDSRNPGDVYLYTTTWYSLLGKFTKYRINTGTSNQSATMDTPAGIAVHPTADFAYITSGDPDPHDLKAYNTNTMTEIQNVPMPGTATDLFVGQVIFVPYCGDGNVDSPQEQCDDGNNISGDGCSPLCQFEVCGNGILDPLEQCDDGNNANGDGCSSTCQIEATQDCWWVRDHVTEINLSCVDPQPHPVGYGKACFRISFDIVPWLTRMYCQLLNGTMQGPNDDDYCCVDEGTTIIFQEDSFHDLEFYCIDALGNMNNETDLEYFRVDSIPPIINKTLIGPQYGDCPPRPGTSDECWIKDWTCEENGTGTTIHVEAYDNNTYENCTVGEVTCDWHYYVDGSPRNGSIGIVPPFDIRFYEDTVHELHIVCRDALGNDIEDIETFYVDSQPPVTNKTYGDPQKIEPNCSAMCMSQCMGDPLCFEECTHAFCTIWINSSTPITLNATDNPKAPCASGVNETYWRNTVVPDNYCYDVATCDMAQGMGNWTEYTGPFNKPEESCHLIEYYSVDNLGIEEEVKKQCVFVDNTPPKGNKTVGDPKLMCDGSEFNITTSGGMSVQAGVQGVSPVTLYVIADNSKQPNLLEAYNVEANGTLTYVSNYTLPTVGNGAVGTALDTVNDQLFVTFEFIGDVYVFDANNFNPLGNISTPSSNLAGTFVDPVQGYLYVAARGGSNVYVYDTTTYANITTYSTGLNIYGMALDHNNNKIYVTDGSTIVYEYNMTMGLLNTYSLPNGNVGIAVDSRNPGDVYLYTTTWSSSPGKFTKYRINTGTSNQSATMDRPAGIAVHPTADFAYITSGDPNPHDLKAYNTNTMTEIQNVLMPGTATDLFVGEVIFVPYCGDGNLDSGEQCDDGNLVNGDGCDDTCQIEYPTGPDCWWVRDHVTEITLDCEDQGDHPVEQETVCYRVSYDNVSGIWGYITDQYCTEFGGTMEGDWCCAYVGDVPYVFNFTEDSVHDLEFYCRDHLGNTEETTDLEYFKVDSVAPTTDKTYLGAYYLNETTGAQYIDTDSWIELTAEDGGPICAVGVNVTQYRVSGALADSFCEPTNCDNWMTTMRPRMGPWETYTGLFGIANESCHVIEYRSIDLLGNTEEIQWQCVFVDKTPPVTSKTYTCPFFEEGDTKWITNMTSIILFAYDPEPHPSGVNRTYYRDIYLNDSADWHYCYNNCSGWTQDARYGKPTAPEPYNPKGHYEYTGLEESCHIIEYYSVDNVNKTETLNHQCVFVDNTAPVPNKTVGKPSTYCDNSSGNCTWEWKITTMTPVTLSCDDMGPHPSDHSMVHWRVWWDGSDNWTEWNVSEEGTEIYFEKECLHQLEFYCTDAVGHESERDLEWIKVEGTSFEIQLNKKWNLISVPFVMLDDSIDEVFADIADKVESVWTYDRAADEWYVYTPGSATDTLSKMKPGWGYWVKTTDDVTLSIGGSLFSPATTPASKKIVKGWNLVGYWGTEGMSGYYGPAGNGVPAYCEFYSLGDDIWDKEFASLWSYWEPYNLNKWIPFDEWCPRMDPGAGYWLFTNQEGEFVVPTTCGYI